MITRSLLLCNERYLYPSIYYIMLKENTWILSVSGLKTPGGAIKFTLNVLEDEKMSNNDIKKTYYIISQYNEECLVPLDQLMYINSVDIDDETFSVFEVLPKEN